VKRRALLGLLGAVAAGPVWGQKPTTQRRIAFVHSGIPADQLTEAAGPLWVRRFLQTLAQAGYIEGRNLTVERYSAEGRLDRYDELVQRVVERSPEVIVTNANQLTKAFLTETATIPIVAFIGNPLGAGLVKNLARPGGNMTGVSVDPGVELYQKQLQIIKEAVPSAVTVAFLGSPRGWDSVMGDALRAVEQRLGLSLIGETPPLIDDLHLATLSARWPSGKWTPLS